MRHTSMPCAARSCAPPRRNAWPPMLLRLRASWSGAPAAWQRPQILSTVAFLEQNLPRESGHSGASSPSQAATCWRCALSWQDGRSACGSVVEAAAWRPHAQPWMQAVPSRDVRLRDAGNAQAADPTKMVMSLTAALPASISRTSHQQLHMNNRYGKIGPFGTSGSLPAGSPAESSSGHASDFFGGPSPRAQCRRSMERLRRNESDRAPPSSMKVSSACSAT